MQAIKVSLPLALAAALSFGVCLVPRTAHAYAWMIRHDYTACASCHVDPSGGGLLTEYGRAQSDLLLRTRYGEPDAEEPDKTAGFLWGLVHEPAWLNAGGSFRGMGLAVKPGSGPTTTDFILMQADLRAEARVGGFRVNASVGAVSSEQPAAAVAGSFVSREHWVGYGDDDEGFLVRAGRINLPYGLRIIEHTMFVRAKTRTDLNDTQQHGVAFAYTGSLLRGEVMGILGNYQLRPDSRRERGYSAYLEIAPLTWAAFGVSSLITHSANDIYANTADTRQAHGVYTRVAIVKPLVLLAELDYIAQALRAAPDPHGYAGMLQLDFEPLQGLHAIAAAETHFAGDVSGRHSYAGWFGIDWFCLPHTDVRIDAQRSSVAAGNMNLGVTALMAQLHVFL
ncbi:MAG TPA: hypothetical protein VHM19_02535 [Polyangiales bacterium]|jgi:hypothetical protein|nr:hypothetical protein [Polyangiales bacterium]